MTHIDNIFYTPLDIPFLPFIYKKEITEIFHSKKTSIGKPSDSRIPEFWDGILCYKKFGTDESKLLYPGEYVDLEHLIWNEVKILNENLPLEVETISLWKNKIYVVPHTDQKVYNQEKDFRFRFVIEQENPSFFINYQEKNKYIDLPQDTNVFAFNNYACKHGADVPKGQKILGVVRGQITDNKKFYELIERSVEKYNPYIITTDQFQ